MRCAQFTRSAMRKPSQSEEDTTSTGAASKPPPPSQQTSSGAQPTRRSSRECKPPQSLIQSSHGVPSSAQQQTQGKASTRGTSLASMTRSQQPSSSLNTTATTKPAQPHVRSGGRHPNPPTGNNAKLKHKCPFDGCPWRFATPYKLRRHIKSHTKETPYLCKECGRGFSVRYNLLMHIQTIHSQPQKFKCPIRGCKDAFHSQSRLNGHLRRIHKKDWKTLQANEIKSTEMEVGVAQTTESTTPSASQTTTAGPTTKMSASRKAKHECSTCGKEYPTIGKLNAHMRTHTGDKPHKCTVQGCDKSFATKEKLNRHADTHKNTKQFCCPHKNCNRVFLRQSHLKNHLKIHTQDHQFVCPVLDCSQKFSSEGEYNVHLNSHINYGYKCPHPNCDLSFPSRKRLAFHARAVHNATSPTPDSGCTSPVFDGIQPHLGLPNHSRASLPLPHASFAHSHTSSHSASKPHLLRYVNKEIIKDVDLPGLSVEDIEAVLSENEDWSGEQMDQFLRSAIDLSDIEAKVLSGGYESDSGYSTYDVSPITSSAPTQLTYPASAQMAAVQPHGHHIEPAFFNYALSPTAPVFPAHAAAGMNQPSTSLLHDMQSPCSSDVGFFSPHSGFSSHATTPSHQDALSFFPAHGACPMFGTYSQPQDFDPLNMTSCFPNTSVPNSDSTIPTFSSQIPDILLPGASLTSDPVSIPSTSVAQATEIKLPKLEPVHSACKLQVPQPTKPVEEVPVKFADSAVKVKVEVQSTSCAVACQNTKESKGQVKVENVKETKPAIKETAPKPSQAVLTKLLSPSSGAQPKIVSITAISNNGTTTQLQLKSLVGQPASTSGSPAKDGAAKPSSQSGSVSDSEVHSVSIQASPCKARSLTSSPKSVPMKASQKKKGQWPRSMSKANLMAFREHILNKLKKGQGNSQVTGSECELKEKSEGTKIEVMKCETPSPSTSGEVSVTYERNHSSDSRCHSEPADVFGRSSGSSCVQLQSSQSEGCLASATTTQQQQAFVPSDVDTKLAEFFPQNCNDVLNLFQFNPDAFLSTTIDDQLLDGLDLGFDSDDTGKVDSEIARFLDSEMSGSSSESPMEIDAHFDVMRDPSPIATPPLSHHASPLVSPASHPSSPHNSATPSCSYTPTESRPYLPERALVTGHVTTGPMSNMQMGMFNFPEILVGGNGMGGVSCESDMKLHIQQNLLQAHHDPLLTGSSTLLQACGSETFEF